MAPGIISCPYGWCQAEVELIHTGKDPQPWTKDRLQGLEVENISPLMIPQHNVEHPALRGTCPASLMHFPIRPRSRHREILIECATADHRRVEEWLLKLRHKVEANTNPQSQSLRGPHRIGREPPPRSKHWQLKGREDEDIQPEAVRHDPPPGVQGKGLGMSISDALAALNQAAIHVSEARGVVEEAKEKLGAAVGAIEQAKESIGAALGNASSSQTIQEYYAIVQEAESEIQKTRAILEPVPQQLGAGLERGETYAATVGG